MSDFFKSFKFIDSAGVTDAAGKPIRYSKMANGGLYPPFGEENIKRIKTTKLRPDDVILCGFPKSGCHWTWEILNMIIKGKGEYSKLGKSEGFLEVSPPEMLEAYQSPRILNTHAPFHELPKEVKTLNIKLILTVRNPKDTAVSMYNHLKNLVFMYDYDGKFEDWLPNWFQGKNESGPYVDYHLKWDQVIRENPDHPILVVSYEDMVEDLEGSIRNIAQFLGKSISDELVSDIASAGTFKNMKENFKSLAIKEILRKGKVGDWKDWLTVSASEEMDKWQTQLDKTVFKFKYTL
ncbi:Sulfotransferase cytosolic 1B member 1 [Bulinus truncatus]|nr:Sulfotransferase cytosolic 1B member 1 [Bulinus truncatus]